MNDLLEGGWAVVVRFEGWVGGFEGGHAYAGGLWGWV